MRLILSHLFVGMVILGHASAVDSSATPASRKQVLAEFLLEYMEVRYPGVDLDREILYVSVRSQRLYHIHEQQLIGEYVISTSAKGLGEVKDSERTPTGLHQVQERIGEGLPAFSILEERKFTGELAVRCSERSTDRITSRILWLNGLEDGANRGGKVDSHERHIYIHGTADECSLGRPSSHGCIRMNNSDVIELFDKVPTGTLVVIYDN